MAAKTSFESVEEYLKAQSRPARTALQHVRGAIRKALPEALEVISYKIPAYKLQGRVVLYFAGWKEHYSIYPASDRMRAALKESLAPYEVAKGTIRFPVSQPVPVKLIERIAKLRAKEATVRKRVTRGAPKKR